ncbi:peptidase family m49 domain-containing protein [Ditylenchus destructor]|nr:peptidase family m49 domain-containing protein [Ditylenchus destructor]
MTPQSDALICIGGLACVLTERALAVESFDCGLDHCEPSAIGSLELCTSRPLRTLNPLRELRDESTGHGTSIAKALSIAKDNCHARYVLFRVCLEAGQGFVTVTETTDPDARPNLLFKLDRSKIFGVGFLAVQAFLKKLPGYKSTGNAVEGLAFFKNYSEVSDEHLHWRDIILSRMPKTLIGQPKLVKMSDDSDVQCQNYEPTTAGLIKSYVERYSKEAVLELLELWKEQRPMFYD